MFGTKGVKTEERKSNGGKYLTHGVVKAKINSLVVQKAKSSEARRVIFYLESEPVADSNFQGVDGAKGRVGRMFSGYMSSDKAYSDFIRQLGTIADKLGVRQVVDSIQSNDFEDYMTKISALFVGKFLWWNIGAEEYDEKKTNLQLLKYNFVKSLEEVDESTLKFDGYIPCEVRNAAGVVVLSFDKNNKYHFRPYVKPDSSFNHPGAAMFGTASAQPKPATQAFEIPTQKPFSVDDLPFGNPISNPNDLPFDN